MENNFKLKEIQDKAFDLCLAIYRMVKHFPENETLVNQIKNLANELTANILILEKTEKNLATEANWQLEKINVFLRIAGTQGWLNPINFDFLMNGYEKLKNELLVWENMNLKRATFNGVWIPASAGMTEADAGMTLRPALRHGLRQGEQAQGKQEIGAQSRKEDAGKKETKKPVQAAELNQRQKKILDFLKKRQEAKMNDLQGIFKGEVTERTLRNDLQSLVAQKLIKSEGEFKTRKYYLK
jgi:hypothetical protein